MSFYEWLRMKGFSPEEIDDLRTNASRKEECSKLHAEYWEWVKKNE